MLHVKHKINHSSDVNNPNLAHMCMHKLKSVQCATIYTVIGLNDRQLFEIVQITVCILIVIMTTSTFKLPWMHWRLSLALCLD